MCMHLTCILEALVIFSVSEAADIVRCDKSSGVAEVDCLVIAEYFSRLQVQAQYMQRRVEGCVWLQLETSRECPAVVWQGAAISCAAGTLVSDHLDGAGCRFNV